MRHATASAAKRLGALLCGITALLAGNGCTPPGTFPVIRPVPRYDKEHIARLRAKEYFIRGRDYDRRGLTQMAARLYEMAWEFDQSSDVVRLLLAGKYIELGRYPQAVILISGGRAVEALAEEEKNLLVTAYLKMGQFARAAEVIDALEHKTDANLYSRALISETLGQTAQAIDTYLELLGRKPAALAVGTKTARLMVQMKRYDQADSLVEVLEGQHGRRPDLFVTKGATAFARGDTTGALHNYRQAIAMDSTHEDALQSLAQVHIGRRDYAQAIAAYEQLYRTQSWGRVYGRTLALLYYYDEQYDRAAALLHDLLAADMHDYELHFYLGLVRAAQQRDDVARIQFEKTVALQSGFEDAWQQLCLVWLRRKEYDRALADAVRFVNALENRPSAWRMLGHVHAVRKEYPPAAAAFGRAVILDSSSGSGWFELGSAYERSGHIDSAAVAFRRALAIDPDDHLSANYLGYMWAEKGLHLDSAKTLIELALRHEPDNGAYLDSYAWVFYQRGEYDSAYVYMQRAVAQVGDDPVVLEHLADVYMKLGRFAKAAETYRTCLEKKPQDAQRIEEKLAEARRKKAEESGQ